MASQVNRPSTAFSLDGRRSRQKQPRKHSGSHLAWLRTLPSLVPGSGAIEAAHIRFQDRRYFKPAVGMGEKPDDKWCVPLAAEQHRKQHSMNEQDYWRDAGVDAVMVAALLWLNTENDDAAQDIIAQFSAGSNQP
jgi:hypothetical protein